MPFNSVAIIRWFFVWSTFLSSTSTASDDATEDRFLPHIVMIVIDDLGSHDLGLHGTGIRTPNIDGFVTGESSNGIYLDDYYVLPYCSPTRAALFSGMYPLRTGVHEVIGLRSTAGLPLDIETLPQMLKRATGRAGSPSDGGDSSSAGPAAARLPYQTHAVGKWHLGQSSWKQTPTFRGFDSFFGFYWGGQDYFTHKMVGATDLHRDRSPNCGKGCSEVVDEGGNYSTHVFTREAIRVVEDHAGVHESTGAPLFLYLAYQAVHCPNEVPDEYVARYENRTGWTQKRREYAGMLEAADEGVGNLTAALRRSGLWDNTLVVVTTDNGGPTTVGCPQGSSNYPKRGGKCSLWEGGTTGDALLAGPALDTLLARSAGAAPPSSRDRFRFLFHVVDWFPTLAEWVGVLPSNQTVLDGVSQAEALAERAVPARTELFGGYTTWKQGTVQRWWGPSIRHLNWKLIRGSGGPEAGNILPPGDDLPVPPANNSTAPHGYLLFDLDRDPLETTDLSGVYPEILSRMIYRMELYQQSFVYPQPNNDDACPYPGHTNTAVGPAWYVRRAEPFLAGGKTVFPGRQ